MHKAFYLADSFNQELSNWDTSAVTHMAGMFSSVERVEFGIGNWDVSNVTNMGAMFHGALTFNQDLSDWNVSSVIRMDSMFRGAVAFDQNLAEWDVSNIERMDHMFEDMALSTENYDFLLNGWSSLPLKDAVKFHGGNSQYSQSAQSARDVLTESFGWTVIDGGIAAELNQNNSENQLLLQPGVH